MRLHELKILPKYYMQICTGEKPYEIRKDDRGFKSGDLLLLREHTAHLGYSGNQKLFIIKNILKDFEGLASGYVAMAISEMIDRR